MNRYGKIWKLILEQDGMERSEEFKHYFLQKFNEPFDSTLIETFVLKEDLSDTIIYTWNNNKIDYLVTYEPQGYSIYKELIPKHILDNEVREFAENMQREMRANEDKGDWREFENLDQLLNELEYHKAKLLIAIRKSDKDAVKEHIGDCGNFLMFIGNWNNNNLR